MNNTPAHAFEAIGNIKIRMALLSIAPTAPIAAGELAAFHAFSQMWSATWGVPCPLNPVDDLRSPLPSHDDWLRQEHKNVR